MQNIKNFLFARKYKIPFCVLLILVLLDRWLLLERFTFRYVDDDQSIMWFGAKEFLRGKFHEPFFFGQPYNTLFESLMAVPLIKMGISFPVALTVMMSLVTMFPYFLLSILLFRRKKEIQSLVVLAILILLPSEFGMVTAISRGCCVGIFFAGFALLQLFSQRKFRFCLFGFFSILALYANPNSSLVIFPIGFLFLLEHYRDKKFYMQNFIGAIPAALIWYFSVHFYKIHPEYIVHQASTLGYSFKILKLSSLINFFNDVVPIFWEHGWMIFVLLFSLVILLFKQKEKKSAAALFAGMAMIILSLGFFKVNDGYPTVFYSVSRMFIGIPLLLAFFIAKLDLSKLQNRFTPFLLLIPISFFIIKCRTVSTAVHREVVDKTEHNMYVSEIPVLRTLCDSIQTAAKKNNAELIIVGNDPTKHLVNYGCPCLENNFPVTLEPFLDRRTWVLKEEENKIYSTILFAAQSGDSFSEQLKRNPGIIKISNNPLLYILKNNALNTSALLDSINFPMRGH